MLTFVRISSAVVLFSFASLCYALRVDIQSPSEGVYAVGLSVNGVKYGAPGKSFSQDNLPDAAVYTFGIRIGGLIFDSEDIPCVPLNGANASVTLKSNTKATLMYDGNRRCYADVQSA